MLKLYAWQPNGHGEFSWFVLAESEAEAKESVEKEIARCMALPIDDPNRITEYETKGLWTDYFTLTIAERGQPVINANE